MNKNYKDHCIYCGSTNSIHRDHIIPKSWSMNYTFFNTSSNPIVPACSECNRTLSNIPIHTPEDRADHLIDVYEKKWKKILKMPDWTNEEMQELGPSLRKSLKHSLKEKELKTLRLKNLYKFKITPFYDYY